MAVVCTENIDSRNLTDGKAAELVYTIRGTEDESVALSELKATASSVLYGLIRQPVIVEPVHIDTGSPSKCIWTGTVQYAPFEPAEDPPATGESVFSFDTGGGSQHVSQSLDTVASYPSSAPDFKGAIGATHDNVEGVDITVPVYNFSETNYLASWQVTTSYKMTLFYLTGKVNAAAFKGLAAGECLFLGATGSKRGTEDWEITFRFAGSLNRSSISVGSITGISKRGWDYLWVRYADVVDGNELVKQPVAAYVERVYDEGNFSALGIGT